MRREERIASLAVVANVASGGPKPVLRDRPRVTESRRSGSRPSSHVTVTRVAFSLYRMDDRLAARRARRIDSLPEVARVARKPLRRSSGNGERRGEHRRRRERSRWKRSLARRARGTRRLGVLLRSRLPCPLESETERKSPAASSRVELPLQPRPPTMSVGDGESQSRVW